MSIPLWSLFLGILLITMVLIRRLLPRLLLSSAMIYLFVGFALGPGLLGVIMPDPILNAHVLERATEFALLVSLFSAGLRLGSVPWFDRRWILPLRLAFVSMAITVGLIAAVGVWGLGLSLGAAVLLGGILAPTDPVLASGVQTEGSMDMDRLRFSLAGEAGLNDGTAFPFVMLGLGLMGWHELGANGWHWWAVDLLWATVGGFLIGTALGTIIGKFVVHLRTRHQQAVGRDEFLSLGVMAITYGASQLCLASGFLAVFAAGLALNRVKEKPLPGTSSLGGTPDVEGHAYEKLATHSHHASETMTDAVLSFNEQMEKIAGFAIVLLVGAILPFITSAPALWWFIPLLFICLRPLAVSIGALGEPITSRQRRLIFWFGIRGIGSIYYLLFAIDHGVDGLLAQQLISYTLVTVSVSILAHGISAWPLMHWHRKLRQ
jgi:NhaP-type Na+/H+ or K+/H+ antiporter